MGCVLRKGSGDLLIADCKDLENLSASESSKTKESHMKERCRLHVRTDLSNSDLPRSHSGERPAG